MADAMTFKQKKAALAALDRATSQIGGVADTARALEVSRRAIYNWKEKGVVPADKAVKLEDLTDGQVGRWEFRPDLFKSPDGEQ